MLAPSGISGELITVFEIKNDTSTPEEKMSDTTLRKFTLKGLFSKTPLSNDSINASLDSTTGSSYFSVDKEFVKCKIQMGNDFFHFELNDKNEWSSVIFECEAISYADAKSKFHNSVIIFIDYVSYFADLPLKMPLLESRDVKNGCVFINYESPYVNKKLSLGMLNSKEKLAPIYALYREAKNADSCFYRFLCYYKILEGIFKHLRQEIFYDAKKNGIILTTTKETIPVHSELQLFYKNEIGKPIKYFFDNVLQKQYRDAVAHFVLDDSTVLKISDYEVNAKFLNIIFITELCCRTVINVQESYYDQFFKALAEKNKANGQQM